MVELAQNFPGVYGSRLTGGGFGGCTVSIVDEDKVSDLIDYLTSEYTKKYDMECICFETTPEDGARILKLD